MNINRIKPFSDDVKRIGLYLQPHLADVCAEDVGAAGAVSGKPLFRERLHRYEVLVALLADDLCNLTLI